ncbi:unnamed protein product [Cuscuta epithymum]|uniref:Reverse transcriptase zinc-binding domain-containing protein n=1 Tax=Cuscuta epithymum TaxID=186058 RepID=A0AAV0EWD1_9ASTE|nr:unnamed protein product [Cuscuta epithymum]
MSLKSCYRYLWGEVEQVGWKGWTKMWNFFIPPKVKHFFWQVCSVKLPTTDRLRGRRVDVPDKCVLCLDGAESSNHLFLQCSLARSFWEQKGWLGVGSRHMAFLEWVRNFFSSKNEEQSCEMIMFCWSVWQFRNRKVWHNENVDMDKVAALSRAFLQGWQQAQFQRGAARG